MDASFGGNSTPSPWYTDAVGGRPPHHSTADQGTQSRSLRAIHCDVWANLPYLGNSDFAWILGEHEIF
jgi:hypothetical protein